MHATTLLSVQDVFDLDIRQIVESTDVLSPSPTVPPVRTTGPDTRPHRPGHA